jgi:hypothetical protein
MNISKSLIKIGLLLLQVCIFIKVCGQSNPSDSYSSFVKQIEQDMKLIDKDTSLHRIAMQIPYIEFSGKKIPVTVYEKNNIVRKLIIVSYDDSRTTSVHERYYFDETGRIIGHINPMGGSNIQEIFSAGFVKIHTGSGDLATDTAFHNNEMAFYQLAEAKYITDYYLSNFNGLKYSTFDVSANTGYIVKLLADAELRSSPNFKASVTKKLIKGAGLLYVDRSENQDSVVQKGKWIWIKVRDRTKSEGWIWGHPSLVHPY